MTVVSLKSNLLLQFLCLAVVAVSIDVKPIEEIEHEEILRHNN